MKIIKSILPNKAWKSIRQRIIIMKHKRVAATLRYLVDDCAVGKLERFKFRKKANLPSDGKIIWQYWAQGFDRKKMPELVSICLDSVEKYKGDFKLIRLTDDNIGDYLDIPSFINEKRRL